MVRAHLREREREDVRCEWMDVVGGGRRPSPPSSPPSSSSTWFVFGVEVISINNTNLAEQTPKRKMSSSSVEIVGERG